jgi:hypothetical protein
MLNKNKLPPVLVLFFGLIFPLIIQAYRQVDQLIHPHFPIDTQYTFMPLAKALFENSGHFFFSGASLEVGPGTYVYFALHSLIFDAIKSTNFLFSLISVALILDLVWRIAGEKVAVFAVWIFVASPLLRLYWIAPQSEPLFLFLTLLWLWSLTCALNSENGGLFQMYSKRLKLVVIIISGLALAMATLTRGTYLYWIVGVFILALGCKRKYESRAPNFFSCYRTVAWVHGIALLLVGSYICFNGIVHQRFIIANGVGIALYLGNSPTNRGYEPEYTGTFYDDWAIVEGNKHVSSAGDRRLSDAAKWMVSETSAKKILDIYTQKMGAIPFFSKAHLDSKLFNDRAWRVFLVFFAIIGLFYFRAVLSVQLIAGGAFYQYVVHIPVLYSPRYSIGVLELPLIILAALGIGSVVVKTIKFNLCCLLALSVLIGCGHFHQKLSSPLTPDIDTKFYKIMMKTSGDHISYSALSGNPFYENVVTQRPQINIVWSGINLNPVGQSVLKISYDKLDSRCESIYLNFHTSGASTKRTHVDIKNNSHENYFVYGLSNLGSDGKMGNLELVFNCPVGSSFKLTSFEIGHASVGIAYREWKNSETLKP